MKYRTLVTIEMCVWLVLFVIAAFIMAGSPLAAYERPAPSGFEMTGWVFVMILVGAAISVVVVRTYKRWWSWVQYAMGVATLIGAVFVVGRQAQRGVEFLTNTPSSWWAMTGLGVAFALNMLLLNKEVRDKTGQLKQFTVRFSTLMMMFVLMSTTVLLSWWFTPLWAFVLLCAIAVYDAFAVWKLRTMQEVAFGYIDAGFIPGIAVPNGEHIEGSPNIALLGGGDAVFIALTGIVFARYSSELGAFVTVGMLSACIALLFYAKKERFYPAIPYILAGCTMGIGVWFVWLWL
jgi:presenilin-like A22 family membrane protease